MTGDEAQGTMGRRKKRGQQIFIERETSEYEAGSVTKINYNALVLGGGRGGGGGGIEEIVTIFSLM